MEYAHSGNAWKYWRVAYIHKENTGQSDEAEAEQSPTEHTFGSAVSVSKSHDFGWRPTRRPGTQETGPHQVDTVAGWGQVCFKMQTLIEGLKTKSFPFKLKFDHDLCIYA